MLKRITLSVLAAIVCLMSHAAVSSQSDLYGNYIATSTGYQWFNYSTWEALPTGHTVTISAYDDGVAINNLLGYGCQYVADYDASSNVLDCWALQGFNTYFTVSDTINSEAGFKGKVLEDGSILFDNFTAWYGSTQYIYTGATVKLQKLTQDWTATGTLTYYSDENETTAEHSATTTLTKYTCGSSVIYGLKFDGASATPAEMLFTVENDSIGLVNGQQTAGYAGAYYYYCFDGNYSVWVDTSEGCSSFPETNSAEGGKLSFYHFDYDKSSTLTASGVATFVWGTQSGISSVSSDKTTASPVYDLQGRRMNGKLVPGIYVQDGKKFVSK